MGYLLRADGIAGWYKQTLDPGPDVLGARHLSEPLIEHELRHAHGGRHFGLENVCLARIQHAARALFRADLIGGGLSGRDEAGIGEPARAGGVGRKADGRKDVEIIGLSRMKGLAIEVHIRELHAGREQRFALGPRVGLFGRALGLVGRDWRARR